MRITAEVSGCYDWVPCPAGTQITEDDVKALRVKQMTDGSWHMKVEDKRDTVHDTGIHEAWICNRLATLEKVGKPKTREEAVVDMLRASMLHHLHPKHMVHIEVHDDGPDEALFKAELEKQGVTGVQAEEALSNYLDAIDLEPYLNVTLNTKSAKAARKAK